MLAVAELTYACQGDAGVAHMYDLLLHKVSDQCGHPSEESVIHVAQIAIFLEVMHTLQPGNEQIVSWLKHAKPVTSKQHKPQDTSKLHKKFSEELLSTLKSVDESFRIENEFQGLKSGVYPVDIAVYSGDTLIALIEVDGPHHRTLEGKTKRQYRLKQRLYKHAFPSAEWMIARNETIQRNDIKEVAKVFADRVVKRRETIRDDTAATAAAAAAAAAAGMVGPSVTTMV